MFYFGRESYRKNGEVILYCFLKSMLFVLPRFWYGFFSAYTTNQFYEPFLEQFYTIVFTFLPIILYGFLDK